MGTKHAGRIVTACVVVAWGAPIDRRAEVAVGRLDFGDAVVRERRGRHTEAAVVHAPRSTERRVEIDVVVARGEEEQDAAPAATVVGQPVERVAHQARDRVIDAEAEAVCDDVGPARKLSGKAGGGAAGVEPGGPEIHFGVARFGAAAQDADETAIARNSRNPLADAGHDGGVVGVGDRRTRAGRSVVAIGPQSS